ncbi:MAG: hypothetical protein IT370_13460 [Deltaproteobacteria bacterium]|nr:hypothetical protein [Deltaproteobacteria bacterium]
MAGLSACGGDDDDTPAVDGGGAADGGSTVDAAASGCQPTGGLAMTAVGKATIIATLSDPAGGYNGVTTPFTGVELFGAASVGNWFSDNEAPSTSDANHRRIQFTFTPAPATACASFTTTNMSGLTQLTYDEGGPISRTFKKWWCAGTVIVDTVSPDGKSNTFHFDGLSCKAISVVGNNATGTVKLTGKGSATDVR